MIGQILKQYQIESLLGAGGMGEVYRARDTQLGRDAAIKVLSAEFGRDAEQMARFQREARVLAAMNHPNIATVYEFLEDRAIAMELVEGPTLAERINRGPVPLEESIALARQIVDALEAAHEKGIVHRDLKPGNIKIRPDGTVKVLDFGLARHRPPAGADAVVDSSTMTMGMTQPGVILGTAAYMAPEQASGAYVDWRADIWAFGVVWFEMVTGKQPFTGKSHAELRAAVIATEPGLDAVPARIRALIGKCLRKDVRKRWQSIGDVRLALEEGLGDPAIAERAPTSRLPWAIAAALLLGFAVLAGVHFRESVQERQTVRFGVAIPGGVAQEVLFALSPDGKSLAITAPLDGKRYLWIRRLDSMEARLIPGSEGASNPFWSPDVTQIGFTTDGKLKKVAIAGGVPSTLAEHAGGTASWSPNGVIVFRNQGELFRVSDAGGVAEQVVTQETGMLSDPQFLPGGSRFLFTEDRPGGVYVGSLDGTAPVRVLEDVSSAEYVPSSLAGDPGYLLFRRGGLLMAQRFDPKSLAVDGSAVSLTTEQVINTPGYGPTVLFSSSDTGVLAYQTPALEQLTWVNRTGATLVTIGPPGEYSNFRLSPDQNWVAMDISRYEGGPSARELARMDLRRGSLERLTVQRTPIWFPCGRPREIGLPSPPTGSGASTLM